MHLKDAFYENAKGGEHAEDLRLVSRFTLEKISDRIRAVQEGLAVIFKEGDQRVNRAGRPSLYTRCGHKCLLAPQDRIHTVQLVESLTQNIKQPSPLQI